MKAYCVRCRQKVEPTGQKTVTISGGRRAIAGRCPECGTKTFRFIKG